LDAWNSKGGWIWFVDDNVHITKYALDLHQHPNFGVKFLSTIQRICIDLLDFQTQTLLKWTRENEARENNFDL
jgi:hypothetical protein